MDGMAGLEDLGVALTRWQRADTPVCAVRLTEPHGLGVTAPAQLMLTDGVTAHGGLLGGAADALAQQLAQRVLEGGGETSCTAEIAVSGPEALDVGLACAGSATVFAHLLPSAQAGLLGEGFLGGHPVALVSCSEGILVVAGAGAEQVSGDLGEDLTQQAVERSRQLMRAGVSRSAVVELGAGQGLIDVWVPETELLLIGTGALNDALSRQAALLGWSVHTTTEVVETEQAVATLTAADAIVLLDHDPAFDGALLRCARGRGFAGALGARHTQADRRERLRAAGATEAELAQIHGPVGLDLGARTPAETAVSVVAEIIAWRTGRAPTALGASTGRIGA